MVGLHAAGGGRFECALDAQTPPFYLGIHAPGFLQNFEAGPFTLADAKQGVLDVDVPRPATLDISFDAGDGDADSLPFATSSVQVLAQLPGTQKQFIFLASEDGDGRQQQLRLRDLAPGTYRVGVNTTARPDAKDVPGTGMTGIRDTAVNPGRFHDAKTLTLAAGQDEQIAFRPTPLDLNVFRGERTAVVRILAPDGSPAAGRKLEVSYVDGHYGSIPVFSGELPDSGEVVLEGLTDRKPVEWPFGAYNVKVQDKSLGFFGFQGDARSQEFILHVEPLAGDLAPDVDLLEIATGKTTKLSDLRGKVVLIEFWATWCGPCQPAMAKLNEGMPQLAAQYGDQLAIVPVSIDTNPQIAKKHAHDRGWNHLVHYWSGGESGNQMDSPAMRAFVGFGVPDCVLVDRNGRIAWRGHPMSETNGQTMKTRIEAVLAGEPIPKFDPTAVPKKRQVPK